MWKKDGNTLFTGSFDQTIIAWDLEKRIKIFQLIGHKDFIQVLCLSKDENYLYSAGGDKTIIKWDLE